MTRKWVTAPRGANTKLKMLTLNELKERLVQEHDVDTLVEMLGISPEELLDAFEEKVQANYEKLQESLQES